jgi:hypothetical protein
MKEINAIIIVHPPWKESYFRSRISNEFEFKVMHPVDMDVSKLVSHKKYIPQPGDRLWFYPDCTVPRFKIKELCEKHKIAMVKTRDRANVKLISPEHLEKHICSKYDAKYKKQEMLDFLYALEKTHLEITNTRQLIEAIEASNCDLVYSDDETWFRDDKKTEHRHVTFKAETLENRHYMAARDEQNFEALKVICDDPEIFFQDEILKLVNTAVAMSETQYHNIKRLLASSNNQDLAIGMEMMANCDFIKSAPYLLLLISEYNYELYNAPTKHHINFKSLLKFFNIKTLNRFNLDDVIRTLSFKNILTQENIDIVYPQAISIYQKESKYDAFQVSALKLNPELSVDMQDGDTELVEEPVEELNPDISSL